MWEQIAAEISQATGEPFNISQNRSVGGGCINQSSTLSDGERTFFIKLNQASTLDMFIAEAVGVKEMWETHTIRVPKPICWGTAGNSAYLVMEYLDLQGRGGRFWSLAGDGAQTGANAPYRNPRSLRLGP